MKTIFILRYLFYQPLRRKINTQLNKGEQLQALRSTYKVQVHTRMQGSTRLMYAKTPQLDSALALLAMFRHELRYDSAKHQWKVRYPVPRAGR